MSEWIPVADRLPPDFEEVLWFSRLDGILIGDRRSNYDFCNEVGVSPAIVYAGMPLMADSFTHWIPLPEPPSK